MPGRSRAEPVWRKSSRSGGGGSECVEVLIGAETVGIRDSKDPDGGQLRVSRHAWASFIDGVKHGTFDLHPAAAGPTPRARHDHGWT